jgi:hypothetical protein
LRCWQVDIDLLQWRLGFYYWQFHVGFVVDQDAHLVVALRYKPEGPDGVIGNFY